MTDRTNAATAEEVAAGKATLDASLARTTNVVESAKAQMDNWANGGTATKKKQVPTRRCDSCGQFQRHEQLTAVATADGGVTRVCGTCLDDTTDDGTTTFKELAKEQWAEAVKTIDEAMSASRDWFRDAGTLAKSQSSDRLRRSDPISNFGAMCADYRSRWAKEARLVSLAKAELTRRETAKVKAKSAKLRRRIATAELAKSESESRVAAALAEQVRLTAETDQLQVCVNAVVARAEAAYGAVEKQREQQAAAELARQDQIHADFAYKAGQTNDPDMMALLPRHGRGGEPR